jgi:micrococcal nuclease
MRAKYSKDLTLPGLEAMARKGRKGLWSDAEPTPPWEFRRPKINKVSTAASKASVEGICFVDQRGEYQFVDGRKRYGC